MKYVALILLSWCVCASSALKLASKQSPGFDGFGKPDPFNRNDDDEVDQGEPNSPRHNIVNDDPNMITANQAADEEESFVQRASKKVLKKVPGFDGFGKPDPFNRNDDDE